MKHIVANNCVAMTTHLVLVAYMMHVDNTVYLVVNIPYLTSDLSGASVVITSS